MPSLTIGDAVRLFETTHLVTLKDPASTRSRLKHFAKFHGRSMDSLTVLELQQFFNEMQTTYPSQAYASLKLLRQLYKKMAEWQQYQGFSPAEHVKIKRPPARNVFLDEHELARLGTVLNQYSLEERLYIWLLLTVFPRSGDANKSLVREFSFWIDERTKVRQCKWTRPKPKNGSPHFILLPPQLTDDLWTYLQTRPNQESPLLFPGRRHEARSRISWWYRWDEIRSTAGLEHIHIHDLRRTGSTWAVETTGDLTTVSRDGLQHADLKTTSIYVQSTGKKALQMFTAHEQALRPQKPGLLGRLLRRTST